MTNETRTTDLCNGRELSRLSMSNSTYHEYLDKKKSPNAKCGGFSLASILLTILCTVLMMFIVAAFVTKGFGFWLDQGCHTKYCVDAASRILRYIDLTADPCHDFYQFSCGNYGKFHVIPPGKNDRTPFEDLRTTEAIRLSKLLEESHDRDPSHVQEAKIFYKTCMDEQKIDKLGIEPLKDYLRQLGGWTVLNRNFDVSKFSFEDYWVKLGANSFSPSFSNNVLSVSVRADPDDHSRNIIALYQARLGMGAGTRDNYLNGTKDSLVRAYTEMFTNVAKVLGGDARLTKREIAKIINFEIELARISLKPEDLSESANNSVVVTLKELDYLYPGIDLRKIIEATFSTLNIKVNSTDKVRVGAVPFFRNLGPLLQRTKRRTLAGYLMWRNVERALSHLNKKTREIHRMFTASKTGIRKEGPRFRSCTSRTNLRFPLPCAKLFADEYFRSGTDNIRDLTMRVKTAFKRRLKNAVWLDSESRGHAEAKIDAMIAKIAFPDYLGNDTELSARIGKFNFSAMDEERYFTNVLGLDKTISAYSLRRLVKSTDKYDWLIPPITVNAYYSRITNGMTYPLGVLYPPFYDNGGMQALNFGAIGEVIGHEITHGFDDSGRLYDKDGNKKQWMTGDSVERFKARAQCVIDAYDNITVKQIGEKVNGKLTQGENIADIGGLAQAFDAYQEWVRENGRERRLPGLDTLSPDQIFFVGYAQLSCSLSRDEALRITVRSDPHTPPRERVLGALYNSVEFSDVFQCSVGSPMNPKTKCQIW